MDDNEGVTDRLNRMMTVALAGVETWDGPENQQEQYRKIKAQIDAMPDGVVVDMIRD
jgi:hypothetical protein